MAQLNQAAWYDEYYKFVQTGFAPWYRFAIPDLRRVLTPQSKLVELGCGQGHLLRYLVQEQLLPEENIYGMDQSTTAVEFVYRFLPKAHLSVGDIYRLEYPKDFFDVCLLMETIEHLEEPQAALQQIHSIVAPGGLLYISFPNYLCLPWLPVRILAEKLNKPNWVVLQPVDKIYTVFTVIRLVRQAGFQFVRGIGSNYGLPLLYPLEKDWMTRFLNSLRLWRFCFHPILVFRKPPRPGPSQAVSA